MAGAVRAWKVRDADPVKYLQRVFTRSKRYGRAHLLLAEILFARGATNQAMMELKFACSDEPKLATPAVALAVRHRVRGRDLDRMVPEGEAGIRVMDTLGAWMHSRDPKVGRRFDDMVLKQEPTRTGPLERRVKDRIAALRNPDNTLCAGADDRKACADQIEKDTSVMAHSDPTSSRPARLRSEALIALGQLEDADKALASVCDTVKDRAACLRARVPILVSMDRKDDLESVLEAIAATGCTSSETCGQTHYWIGQVHRNRKNWGAAANSYRRATRYDSRHLGAWIGLGDCSAELGLNGRAADAYGRAVKLSPGDAKLQEKAEKARRNAVFQISGREGR